jgi:hypothetical protein
MTLRSGKTACSSKLLTVLLAVALGGLPSLSALHLTQVAHVYSSEHRHFHELVASSGRGQRPLAATTRAAAEPGAGLRDATALVSVLEVECPLANAGLRNDCHADAVAAPDFAHPVWTAVAAPRLPLHCDALCLVRAPKHSPPLS